MAVDIVGFSPAANEANHLHGKTIDTHKGLCMDKEWPMSHENEGRSAEYP